MVVLLLLELKNSKSGKMAQWVKVFASKPGGLSFIPESNMIGKNQLPKDVV